MATTPGKDNKKTGSKDVNKGPTGTGSAKDQGKDISGNGPGSGPVDVVKIQADLDKANEANIKLSENFTKLEEKKAKAEKYIVELKEELKDARGLVKALRTELLAGTPDGVAKDPTPEEKKEAGATGIPDGICGLLTCKKPFNVEDGLIKDETSRAFMSTRCPFCGKIQNAENARLRFAEAR